MNLTDELEGLTDKLLEVSMKLKLAESELVAVREEHEKELSKFSHNLKNPVGIISSFVEMMQSNESLDEEKRLKYLSIIKSSSKFSIDLINSFEEYYKLKNGSIPFKLESVNYNAFIQELAVNQRTFLEQRKQVIEVTDHSSFSENCLLDKEQFSKVFNNIVSNASRFSSENSKIIIEISTNESEMITTFSDSGLGVSASDLPKLSQSFFTANSYDVYHERCMGLGLSKAKMILNKMGGTLSFKSEPEKGTQVNLRFNRN